MLHQKIKKRIHKETGEIKLAVQYNPRIITDSLVLCLDAANPKSYGGSGITWRDLSGRGNTGTLVNGVGYVGTNGGSLSFDGVNDYANLGTQSNLTGITNITVCGWSQGSGTGFIINRYYNTTSDNGWILSVGGVGGRKNASTFINVPSNYSPSLNEWVYTVGVISGDVWSVYVNGTIRNSVTAGDGTTVFANNVMYMGAVPQFSLYSNIKIPQVSIYNRALSASEVKQNYNATKSRYGL
jgi:hypothetical protein